MQKTKTGSRFLALLLTLVMIAGLLPAMSLPARAEDTAPAGVTVTVAAIDTGAQRFIMMPTEITVPEGMAAKYGYVNNEPGTTVGGNDHGVYPGQVSALDALVAAHELRYGGAFQKGNQLGDSSSFVTKMFGVSGYFVFTVNDLPPMGNMSDGYAVNEYVLKDGDFLMFVYPEDDYGFDASSYFTERSKTVEAGEDFELTLMGYDAMEALWGNPGSPTPELTLYPVEDAQIHTIDPATGNLEPLDVYTNAQGKATLSFDEPGTYYVCAVGVIDVGWDDLTISLPYCEVTVAEDDGGGNDIDPIDPVKVQVSFSEETTGFLVARQDFEVTQGLAKSYGYTYAPTDKITAIDAFVAALLPIYKTQSALNAVLQVTSDGSVKYNGEMPVYFVNGEMLNDGAVNPLYGEYTGYKIPEAEIFSGDIIEFFMMKDGSMYMDYYAWFEHDGGRTDKISVETGENIDLVLRGYMAMWSGLSPFRDMMTDELDEVTILVLDDGYVDYDIGETDGGGKATISFDTPGVYIITAVDFGGWYDILLPWLEITVTEAAVSPALKLTGLTATNLNAAGLDFDPDTLTYSVTTAAAATASIALTPAFDDEKYNLTAGAAALASGAAWTYAVSAGLNTVTLRLEDKSDSTVYTEYTINVLRPRAATLASIEADTMFEQPVINNYPGGTLWTGKSGEALGTGSAARKFAAATKDYRVFYLPGIEVTGLNSEPTLAASWLRLSIGDEVVFTGNAISDYQISLTQDIVLVKIEVCTEDTYDEYGGFVAEDTYTISIERVPITQDEIDKIKIQGLKVTGGELITPFVPESGVDFQVKAVAGDTVTYEFTLADGTAAYKNPTSETASNTLTPSSGVYTHTAKANKPTPPEIIVGYQTAIATARDVTFNGLTLKVKYQYKFWYAFDVPGTPDAVVDYIVPGSQYSNAATYGMAPERVLYGSTISLGNFGGYMTVKYDEPIKNDPNNKYGIDFKINGNSVGGQGFSEPGNVWVSQDGVKFYLLAGSDYYDDNTIRDYEVTYIRGEDGSSSYRDNYGSKIEIRYNSYGGYKYPLPERYPLYNWQPGEENEMTFRGPLITDPGATDPYGSQMGAFPDWGYVDVRDGDTTRTAVNPYTGVAGAGSSYDISWAIDTATGEPVYLDEISYIRISTASHIYAGSIGEKSTEVSLILSVESGASPVGATTAPSAVKVNGAALDLSADKLYYTLNADGSVTITVEGAEAVYINNARGASRTYATAPMSGVIRVIVQEGSKEPVIYYLYEETSEPWLPTIAVDVIVARDSYDGWVILSPGNEAKITLKIPYAEGTTLTALDVIKAIDSAFDGALTSNRPNTVLGYSRALNGYGNWSMTRKTAGGSSFSNVTNFNNAIADGDSLIIYLPFSGSSTAPVWTSLVPLVTTPNPVRTPEQRLADLFAAELTFDKIKGTNTSSDSVRANLGSLPSRLEADAMLNAGFTISWTSSDISVVTNGGSVSRPAYGKPDAQITMTAAVTKGTAFNAAKYPSDFTSVTVLITFTVQAITEAEYEADRQTGKPVVDYCLENLTVDLLTIMGGETMNPNAVVYDIQLKDPRDIFDPAVTPKTTVDYVSAGWYTSDKPDVISINYLRASVKRPAPGEPDAVVKITMSVNKGFYSGSKTFTLTVPAVTQNEIDAANAELDAVAAALTFDVIKNANTSADAVKTSLQMVYRGLGYPGNITWATNNSGYSGVEITWATSDSGTVATYGTVTRPGSTSTDKNVIMTATLKSIRLGTYAEPHTAAIPIIVRKVSNSANISSITTSLSIGLDFNVNTKTYNLDVSEFDESVEITVITEETGTLVKSGNNSAYGILTFTVELTPDHTTPITITTEALDSENTSEYTLYITRAPPAELTVKLTITYAAATAGINIYENSDDTVPFKNTTSGVPVDVPAGIYRVEGRDATGSMGRVKTEITDDYAVTLYMRQYQVTNDSNSWVLGTDYTFKAVDNKDSEYLPGARNGNYMRYTVKTGDTVYYEADPVGAKAASFVKFSGSATYTGAGNVSIAIPTNGIITFTVPQGATLFVGRKTGAHFVPFTEILPTGGPTNNKNGTVSYVYTLGDNTQYNYRVSQPGKVTYANIFTVNGAITANGVTVTQAQLDADGKNSKTIDRDRSSISGRNVANVFLNINEKGYLPMNQGDLFQIVNIRSWQAIDTDTNNYFMEPDYHYIVIDENGNPGSSVVTVDANGKITAVGNGVAIILVTYDAMTYDGAGAGKFYGAIWPENTGVILVSVGENTGGFDTGMKVPGWYNAVNRLSGLNLDSEIDVIYYDSATDGAYYAFTPAAGSSVSILRPTLTETGMTFSGGFATDGVSENNGEFTVRLIEGRNIIKITNGGRIEYQIITAKKTGITVVNNTRDDGTFMPGDSVSVVFDAVYHPANKLAGIYNMTAQMAYVLPNGTTVTGAAAQYNFATYKHATNGTASQKLTFTIPAGYEGDIFAITKGRVTIPTAGLVFGDPYGSHRDVTYELGRAPNFTASMRPADLAILPDIKIILGENIAEPIDKSALQSEIAKAGALAAGDYTAASWAAMQTALTNAKAVAADVNAAQTQVDSAKNALTTAINSLITSQPPVNVNKTALNAAITQAESLGSSQYTAASWAAMQTALTNAKAVAADVNAAQAQVDSARNNLQSAISALVNKPIEPNDTIHVTFRLIGATVSSGDVDLGYAADWLGSEYQTWIATRSYTMKQGDTNYDLFVKALAKAGITYAGAEDNYVSTIYAPGVLGGYALSEFTNGQYSGWMYTVNGTHVGYGLKEQELHDGDVVIWHYINDFNYEVKDWFEGTKGSESTWNKWLKAPDADPVSGLANRPADTGTNPGGPTGGNNNTDEEDLIIAGEVNVPLASLEIGKKTAIIDDKTIMSLLDETLKEIAEGGENAVGEIIFNAKSGTPEDTTSAEVILTVKSLKEIAKNKNIVLTIATDTGTITLDNATIAGFAAGAKDDDEVRITVEFITNDELNEDQQETVGENPVIKLTITIGGKPVHDFKGTVTVKLPYKTIEDFDSKDYDLLTIYYMDDEGNIKEMKGAKYDAETGTITFTTKHFSLFFISEWISPFADIKKADWFYRSVRYVYGDSLMVGTTAKTFAPTTDLTRAMLVTILWRYEGSPKRAANVNDSSHTAHADQSSVGSFTDVESGQWYSEAIAWANENGIVKGYSDKIFGTNDIVTREQIAVILYRYAQYKGIDVSAVSNLAKFDDAEKVSDWAIQEMKWAVNAGLINGRGETMLVPDGNANRAEAATLLMRFIENIAKKK